MAQFDQSDVESVQTKLQAFASSLPRQEQNILAWVMARNSPELSDAELDDVAGGADEVDTVGVSVSWSKAANP